MSNAYFPGCVNDNQNCVRNQLFLQQEIDFSSCSDNNVNPGVCFTYASLVYYICTNDSDGTVDVNIVEPSNVVFEDSDCLWAVDWECVFEVLEEVATERIMVNAALFTFSTGKPSCDEDEGSLMISNYFKSLCVVPCVSVDENFVATTSLTPCGISEGCCISSKEWCAEAGEDFVTPVPGSIAFYQEGGCDGSIPEGCKSTYKGGDQNVWTDCQPRSCANY